MIVLASGSGGNAVVVEANGARVLLDCGLSFRQLGQRLAPHGLLPGDLQAIFITHEHVDHVRGLEVFHKKHRVPVLTTAGTGQALAGRVAVEPVLRSGRTVVHEGMSILPVATSHDAREPVGFVIEAAGQRVGLLTDTGVVTELVCERLLGCQILLLEANHDLDMLRLGPYPWPLKQRIRSRTGHLSNCQTRDALQRLVGPELQQVVAMHLSGENNTPVLAREELERVLAGSGVGCAVSSQDQALRIDLSGPAREVGGWGTLHSQLSTSRVEVWTPVPGPRVPDAVA